MRILILCCLLFLTGCTNYKIEKAVRSVLKDPNSAIFHEITVIQDHACVTYSAKNSYGGYTGRKEMILVYTKEWTFVDRADITHSQCVDIIKASVEGRLE